MEMCPQHFCALEETRLRQHGGMVKVRATSRTEWENLASGVFVPLHIVGQGQPFLASMDHRDLSHAALTRVRSTEGEVVRTEDLIGDADTDVALFSFQLKGTSEVVQGRNSSVVPPAYGVLYLADIPYRLRFHAMTDLMIVRASASALGLPANTLLGAAASSMRLQDAPALKLLSRIVGSYLSDRPLMPSAAETARVSVELLGEAIAGIAGSISRPRSRAALRAAVLARITSGLVLQRHLLDRYAILIVWSSIWLLPSWKRCMSGSPVGSPGRSRGPESVNM